MSDLERQLAADLKGAQKQNRKLECQLNRYNKLIPGSTRIWNLHRIAMELEGEAATLRENETPHSDPEGLENDALYLRRLEYDLSTLREAMGRPVRGTANRKYDPSQWPRGERP